ncbi:RNA polymerase II transcription mediator complex subunit 9-domain-containing protein [Echria macrotheca]|uniref:Mediator of RNA polymerase II transcription subunit 9 n=1 Tax=Echria macrotheca TaxID=438768 RepID=A0AAJ0B8B7_9PEZI|nr:RNA polymerase II transcription mediator complex subunit 9-domain-containing protein [Echria macrotheca]
MTTQPLPDGLSPDAIDTLTELTTILAKLRAAQAAASATSTNHASSLLGQLGATPAPAPGAVTGTTPLPSGAPNTNATTLTIKELPAATDNLKHKLQRARAAVKKLEDVGRGFEQQQDEIRELEARQAQQLAMLERIRLAGVQFTAGEQGKVEDEGERMVE